MAKNLVIKVGNLEVAAVLNNSQTAAQIYAKLPIEAQVNLWGDEIYPPSQKIPFTFE